MGAVVSASKDQNPDRSPFTSEDTFQITPDVRGHMYVPAFTDRDHTFKDPPVCPLENDPPAQSPCPLLSARRAAPPQGQAPTIGIDTGSEVASAAASGSLVGSPKTWNSNGCAASSIFRRRFPTFAVSPFPDGVARTTCSMPKESFRRCLMSVIARCVMSTSIHGSAQRGARRQSWSRSRRKGQEQYRCQGLILAYDPFQEGTCGFWVG